MLTQKARKFLASSTTRYLLVGGLIYFIDIISFVGSVSAFGRNYYLVANIFAKTVAAIVGFFLHKYFTFSGDQHYDTRWQFMMYIGLFVFNTFLSSILVFLLIDLLQLTAIPSRIAVDVIVTGIAYLISKKIVFRSMK